MCTPIILDLDLTLISPLEWRAMPDVNVDTLDEELEIARPSKRELSYAALM